MAVDVEEDAPEDAQKNVNVDAFVNVKGVVVVVKIIKNLENTNAKEKHEEEIN